MKPPAFATFDPLLDDAGADTMLRIRRDHGGYGMYSNEGFDTQYAPGVPQRFDAVANYLKQQDGNNEDLVGAAARTNYFRETYAYGDEISAPGCEVLLHHEALIEEAKRLHGAKVVVPAILYANILIPGQDLATHTDVPEFRGASRKVLPQWLIVVMHHSGLFDAWRMPIATAVTYFGKSEGGALHHYPEGSRGPRENFATRHNTGIILDTDSIFHGVDRVRGRDEDAVTALRPGSRLVTADDGGWNAVDGGEVIAHYGDDEIRFSISWKAYCFADDAAHARWLAHDDDLALETILGRLEAHLRDRGELEGERPKPEDFARLLIDRIIEFPEA